MHVLELSLTGNSPAASSACAGARRGFFLPLEVCMSDVEMKLEVEADEFTEELSDGALDRAEGALRLSWSTGLGS